MQYPYLTLLEIITVLLTLFVGIIIFYFLLRRWRETKFLTAVKAIALYELGSLLIYLIYPFPLLSRISNVSVLKILDMLIFGIILFFVFYFVMKKILAISWKKSLIAFLLIIVIAFPFLDFFRIVFVQKIMNYSVFAEESARMEAEMEVYFKEYGFGGFLYAPLIPSPPVPMAFKVIGTIENATLSWPSNRLREIIIQIGSEPLEEKPEYSVKVISPNGGEKIEVNQPFIIKWNSKNIGSVNVSLLSSNDLSFDNVYVSLFCSKVDASLGSCQGTLKDFHTAPYYKIRIEGYREKPSEELSYTVITDESDNYFNISIEK